MDESITIFANQSGRLWSDDPAGWERLCSPEDCPICDRLRSGDDRDVVAATDAVLVTAQVEGTLPGYVCVTGKRHAVEPYQLEEHEQAAFFLDAMTVAKGLATVTTPTKMNYEIHGNTMPHLHMRLFPRQAGDVYVGYVITSRRSFQRTADELERSR